MSHSCSTNYKWLTQVDHNSHHLIHRVGSVTVMSFSWMIRCEILARAEKRELTFLVRLGFFCIVCMLLENVCNVCVHVPVCVCGRSIFLASQALKDISTAMKYHVDFVCLCAERQLQGYFVPMYNCMYQCIQERSGLRIYALLFLELLPHHCEGNVLVSPLG